MNLRGFRRRGGDAQVRVPRYLITASATASGCSGNRAGGKALFLGQGGVAARNGALLISGGTARVEEAARMTARALPGWLTATVRATKIP